MRTARKNLLAIAVSASTLAAAAPALASVVEGYEIRVITNVVNGDWLGLPVTYTDWVDVGGHYDCALWKPEPQIIDFGQSYLQTRLCSQDQEREAIITEKHSATGEVTEVDRQIERQTLSEEESQVAVGERRDWQSYDSTYTNWEAVSSAHSHDAWSPLAASQINDYTQGRNYLVSQERYEQKREQDLVTGDIRNTGDPVLHDRDDVRSETRPVDVTSTVWANTAAKVCGAWSPEPLSIDFGQSFTQTRTCDQDQERIWSHDSQGSEIHSRVETRVNTFDETQAAVGERRDWQSFDSTFTDWSNVGSRKNYTIWSPVVDTQESDFGQTRDYDQDQQRFEQKREKDQVTGDIRDVGEPIQHDQTISGTESRTIAVTVGSWTNDGAHYNCATWSPAIDSVDFGENFTQTRDCSQNQTRSRIYKDGTITVDNQTDARTITETESQTVTGTYRNWEPTVSTFTDWTNDGAHHSQTAWSPATTTQISGFTQSRTYYQDQDRYEQKREQDSVTGDIREVGSPVLHEQTISGTDSRSVTVSWTTWTDSGIHKNCAAWGPSTDTVNYGETFTQTRDCDQDQTRSRVYKVGTTTIDTKGENRTISETESRTATGTYQNWQAIEPTYTNWSSTGTHSWGDWLPVAASQTYDFTQTRSYKENQERYEQNREQDSVTGTIRNVGDPIMETQTLDQSQSRSVVATATTWSNSGTPYSCGSWGPSRLGTDYGDPMTQTRTCSVDQAREWEYSVGGAVIHTWTQTRVSTASESRQTTGTRYRLSGNQFSAGCVAQVYVDRATANGTTVVDEAPRPGSNYYNAEDYGLLDGYGAWNTMNACNNMGLNRHAYTVTNGESCASNYTYVAMTCVIP